MACGGCGARRWAAAQRQARPGHGPHCAMWPPCPASPAGCHPVGGRPAPRRAPACAPCCTCDGCSAACCAGGPVGGRGCEKGRGAGRRTGGPPGAGPRSRLGPAAVCRLCYLQAPSAAPGRLGLPPHTLVHSPTPLNPPTPVPQDGQVPVQHAVLPIDKKLNTASG